MFFAWRFLISSIRIEFCPNILRSLDLPNPINVVSVLSQQFFVDFLEFIHNLGNCLWSFRLLLLQNLHRFVLIPSLKMGQAVLLSYSE